MSGPERDAFVREAGQVYARDFAKITLGADGRALRGIAGGEGPVVLLLHGWPMTSHAWRFVQPALAASGRRAIALDLPGLGRSDPASDGYDTAAVAKDILTALDAGGVERFALVGHDIGGMVSVSLALLAPERLTALCCVETDAPGIGQWEQAQRNPHLWHFHFHATPELPETLIRGRERAYTRFFYDRDGRVPEAWTEEDVDHYAAAQAAPGRLEAGLAYYRAFAKSAERNIGLATGEPLPMPVLAVGGTESLGAKVASDMATIASRVERLVQPCGHFVPEETPELFAPALVRFLDAHVDPA